MECKPSKGEGNPIRSIKGKNGKRSVTRRYYGIPEQTQSFVALYDDMHRGMHSIRQARTNRLKMEGNMAHLTHPVN